MCARTRKLLSLFHSYFQVSSLDEFAHWGCLHHVYIYFLEVGVLLVIKTAKQYKVGLIETKLKMQLPRKMSAQNVMASITRTLGTREKVQANEIRFAGEERKDKLYEPKHKKKLIRVLTVIAYIIFVSMAAIILSLYYTFLWDPMDQSIRTARVKDQVLKPDCKTSDTIAIPSTLNETQIGKTTTAKSITTNETTDETSEMSTTLREKSLLQILTGTTKTKEIFPYTSSSSIASKESRMIDVVTTTKSYKEDKSRN